MAKNRKNEPADLRFGPVLKVVLLCLLIGGSAIGFVWQKNQIDRLGRQIAERESRLRQLKNDNKILSDQIAFLNSPLMLDRKVHDLNLGLAPAQPTQVVRLAEPVSAPPPSGARQLAQRPAASLAP
jgi:cell division protein FtsB